MHRRRSIWSRHLKHEYVSLVRLSLHAHVLLVLTRTSLTRSGGMVSNPYYLARFGNTVINGAPGITSGLQGGVTASMPAGSFAGAIATSKLADGAFRSTPHSVWQFADIFSDSHWPQVHHHPCRLNLGAGFDPPGHGLQRRPACRWPYHRWICHWNELCKSLRTPSQWAYYRLPSLSS